MKNKGNASSATEKRPSDKKVPNTCTMKNKGNTSSATEKSPSDKKESNTCTMNIGNTSSATEKSPSVKKVSNTCTMKNNGNTSSATKKRPSNKKVSNTSTMKNKGNTSSATKNSPSDKKDSNTCTMKNNGNTSSATKKRPSNKKVSNTSTMKNKGNTSSATKKSPSDKKDSNTCAMKNKGNTSSATKKSPSDKKDSNTCTMKNKGNTSSATKKSPSDKKMSNSCTMNIGNTSSVTKKSPDKKVSTSEKKKNENSKKKNAKIVNKSCKIAKPVNTNCKNAKAVNKSCKNAKAVNKSCKISKPKKQKDSIKCKKLTQPSDETLCSTKKESSEAKDVGGSSIQGRVKGRRKQLNPRKAQVKVVSDDTCIPSLVDTPENLSKGKNEAQVEDVLEKKTRGQRKRKKSVTYDFDFMEEEEEEDIDIDYDSPTDEYRPPKCFEEEEDVHDEFEEKIFTKKKRVKKSKTDKNEENSETKKGMKNIGGIDKVTKSAGDGIKKAKQRGMKRIKVDSESQTDGYVDMPDITADDFSMKATVKTRKRKRKQQSNVKKKSCLDEIRDWDKDEDEDDPGERDEDTELNQDDKLVKSKKESRHGQPYSVTGSWYIASGYLQDLTSLLEAFSKEDNLKFKNFSSCWQKLKFSLIYRGRQNFKELLEFSEEVALLTKRFLVPPHNLKWRVGALYTIYGLYYKHPFRHFFKVRLVQDEYEQLLKLVNQFRSDVDNPDPAYIFRKMEVEGAFHHVATSSEMCLDLYSLEREAVDIKYESQRLVNASPIGAALPSDSRVNDDSLLQQYHKTKAVVMGNGKEPERAVSLVQPSFPSEIDDIMKELKEGISVQLGLKEAPSKTAEWNQDKNELSPIGTRRANIRAKAVAVDRSEEYLKKKGLVGGFCFKGKTGRHIQKRRRGRPSKKQLEGIVDKEIAVSSNNENRTVKLSKKSGSSTNKASREVIKSPRLLMDKNVRQFMSPPSAGTLRIPLKPRKKAKVLSNKVTYSMEGEESGVGSESEVDKEHNDDKPPGQKGLETPSRTETSSFYTDQDYEEHLNDIPQVSPPPKRRRGRPRKNVLYRALEVSKGSSPPKEKVPPVFPSQRGRLSRSLREMLKTPRLDNNPAVINTVDAVQIHSNIIDLPAEETSIVLPMQREGSPDESTTGNCLRKMCTTNNALHTKDGNPVHVQDSMNDSICLDVHFSQKGTNIIRKMKFKVKTKVWESIKNDRGKVETLKEKLLQLLPIENLSEESRVNIVTQISASVTEGNMDATKLSQNPSPEDVNPRLQSSSSLFQRPRKANTPINVMKGHSESFLSIPAREKGRGITRHGVGKMLMIPIKIGDVTHYIPASSHTKGNDKGIEQINDELLLPPVKREVSEVTPIVDNYQIPQSSETSETPRKLANDVRAESPDFISSDIKWVSPLPENEVSYILSSAQVREDMYDGVDEISRIRRREYTCRTGASHSKQTVDETPDELWESKDGRESPAESNAELEVLGLHNRNHCQRVLDTKSAQFGVNKPCITKNQIYEAHEVSRGKTREILVKTRRDINSTEVTDPEVSDCYEATGSTSIDVVNCSEASEIASAEEDEDQNDCVSIDVNDFVSDMTSFVSLTQSSDIAGSLSEPVSKSIFYVSDASSHPVEKGLSLSQASFVSTPELSFDIYPSETSVQANYSVIPNEVTSLALPCTSVTSTVRGDMNVPVPLQSRQVQMSPPVMENVMMPFSDAPVIVESSPQQMSAPLAVSTPISSRLAAEHVSLEDVLNSSTSGSHGPSHSTPGWVHQSHHGCIMPLTTTAVSAQYPDCHVSMVTYQKVPVLPIDNSPSKIPEHQPTQQSMLEVIPPRYPGVVTVSPMGLESSPGMHQPSSISTPHNHHSDSLVGLRRLPDIMGSKLLKFKINDKTVLVPADRVLTSATRVTYATQLANESETLEIRQLEKQDISPGSSQGVYDRSVGIQEPNSDMRNQDTIVDDKKFEIVERETLPTVRILTDNQHNPPSSSSVRQLEKQGISPGSSQGGYDRSVGIQEPNSDMQSQDTIVDDKKVERVESETLSPVRILTDNQHNPPSSSSVPVHVDSLNCDIKMEDVASFESCSKTDESRTETGSKLSPFRNTKVCSFLFSPKYKALSVMKETVGPATGTPVTPKKSRVPFLLKQSLVPKKKS